MPMKEISKLLTHLEPQGVTATRTKKGVLLRLPDKSTTMLHFTGSDVREQANVRARLKRAGLEWPGDEVRLGANITDHKPTALTIEKAQRALEQWPNSTINGLQLRRLVAGLDPEDTSETNPQGLTNVSAQRVLYHLGWTPSGKSTGRKWHRPEPELPENVTELAPVSQPDAMVAAIDHHAAADEQLAAELEQLRAEQAAAEWREQHPVLPEQLSPAPEPELEQQKARAAELVAAEVELAPLPAEPHPDAAAPGSWAMELEHLPSDTTIAQLWVYIAALGLQGEVRVWRHG
jgi:hypothetical protein